jgi:hypothetical protein
MSADPLRRQSIYANIILRVPGSPDLQVGNETIHFHPEPTFDKEKYKRILIERSLLNPDDDILVNFGMLSSSDRSVILTRVSDSAGGLANNGSGFNGLPYIAKPPPEIPTPTPIYDQAMAEVIQLSGGGLHSPNPQVRQEANMILKRKDNELREIYHKYIEQVRNLYGDCANKAELEFTHGRPGWMFSTNLETMWFNIIKHIEKKCSMPRKAPNGNLLKFPTLQNNLSGLFSGPAGAGGGGAGSAVRHRKRKQRKTQKRKNRRNRTRKN